MTGIWKVPVTPPYASPPAHGVPFLLRPPPGAGAPRTRPLLARQSHARPVLAGGRARCRSASRLGRPGRRPAAQRRGAGIYTLDVRNVPAAGASAAARDARAGPGRVGSTPNRGAVAVQRRDADHLRRAGRPAGRASMRSGCGRTTSRPTPRCGRWSDVSWPAAIRRGSPGARTSPRCASGGPGAACTTSSTRSWRGRLTCRNRCARQRTTPGRLIAADERWRHLVAALGVGPHEVEFLALLAAVRARPAADPGTRLPRRFRGARAAVAGRRGDAVGLAAPDTSRARPASWPAGGWPARTGPWQATTPWTVDADVAAYLARRDRLAGDAAATRVRSTSSASTACNPAWLAEMRRTPRSSGATRPDARSNWSARPGRAGARCWRNSRPRSAAPPR